MSWSVDHVVKLVVAAFFLVCAYAQHNDPDPAIWIIAYGTGAVWDVLAVFRPRVISSYRVPVALFWVAVAAFYASAASSKAAPNSSVASNDGTTEDVSSVPLLPAASSFAWALLEQEEGREAAGALLLAFNALFAVSSSSSHGTGHTKSASSSSSSSLGLIMFGLVFAAAIYGFAWQPEMNAAHPTAHCNGAFGGATPAPAATL